MSDHGYKFYMQECTKDGVLIDGTLKDLEVDFDGMRYAKCEGIDAYGKAKNIYFETFADSERVRAYISDNITNEATKIKFTFYFTGDNRQETYYEFVEYIRTGQHQYWDTARNRKFTFVVQDEIKPATEKWHGSTPYLEVPITVQNLKGKTESI